MIKRISTISLIVCHFDEHHLRTRCETKTYAKTITSSLKRINCVVYLRNQLLQEKKNPHKKISLLFKMRVFIQKSLAKKLIKKDLPIARKKRNPPFSVIYPAPHPAFILLVLSVHRISNLLQDSII